jgi:hypothetical protein
MTCHRFVIRQLAAAFSVGLRQDRTPKLLMIVRGAVSGDDSFADLSDG